MSHPNARLAPKEHRPAINQSTAVKASFTMPTSSAIQSKLKEHERWLVGLRHDSCMTQAKIQTELEKQKGLVVNSSQLETYFRNLGQRKNLSRAEWIMVFCALDSQKAFGRFFDFYLSGKQIDEQSLQRKRRHAKPARPLAPSLAAADQLLTRLPDGVTVRLRLLQDSEDVGQQHRITPHVTLPAIPATNPNGEASMPRHTTSTNNGSVSGPSAVVLETGAGSSPFGSHTASPSTGNQAQLTILPVNTALHPVPTLQTPLDSNALISSPALEMNPVFEDLDTLFGDSYSFPGSNIWDDRSIRGSPGSFLSNLQNQVDPADRNNTLSIDFDYGNLTCITSGHDGLELGLIEPARLLAENYGSMTHRPEQGARPRLLPAAEKLLENVASLVSTEITEGDFSGPLGSIGGPGLLFTDGFVQLFLFSVVNNFSGGFHKAGIMHLIKQHELLRSTILSHLRNGASTVFSSALAEKLLEPAIQVCDAKTVHDLLELGIFKPDDIVCTDGMKRRTPLEEASRRHQFDIAVSLVRFGADVNKTYEDERSPSERGALECAIGLWGSHRPVDPRLVDLLLESGAIVSSRLVGAAIRWGDNGLIEKLISALSLSEHVNCFSQILSNAAKYLRNDVGHKVIRQLIQTCRDAHDLACIHSRRHTVAEAMAQAARRKNEDLLYLLLPHGGQNGLDTALTAASRSGSHRLVRGLLAHGARGDGPPCHVSEPGAQPALNTPWGPPLGITLWTTPLAEAIRGQDAELVDILSENGAWNQIGESGRLTAVMLAIAESGQSVVLHQVLKLVPNPDPKALTKPLNAAIRCHHEDIALKLLEAGADVNDPNNESPLLAALRMKSQPITWAILESDVDLIHRKRSSEEQPNNDTALEAATALGDREVIKTLVFMGADVNAYEREAPLSIAIKAGERSLIDLLINLGADLNAQPELDFFAFEDEEAESAMWSSPLAAAALVRDSETANYLLEHGTDPADEEAMLKAITPDRRVLDLIIQRFRKQYPKGRAGFGARVLQHGLQRQDEALLDVCLNAAFDVNSMADHRHYEDSENSEDSENLEDSDDSDDSRLPGFPEIYGFVTALGMAIKKYRGGRLDLISKLLDAGGDANMPTSEKRRHHVLSSGSSRSFENITVRQTALLDAIETKSLPLVELLISKGADVRKEAKFGLKRTPLQKACEVASHTIVGLLLGFDVDVNAAPAAREGATALQLAAQVGSLRIAKKLLDLGANVNAPGAQVRGRSAIEYAAEYGRLSMIPALCHAVDGKLAAGQYESAIALAQENGHSACAILLRNLSSANQGYINAPAWQMPQGFDAEADVVRGAFG